MLIEVTGKLIRRLGMRHATGEAINVCHENHGESSCVGGQWKKVNEVSESRCSENREEVESGHRINDAKRKPVRHKAKRFETFQERSPDKQEYRNRDKNRSGERS